MEKIHQAIKLAIHAPSGENCQPWRFVVKGDVISIFNLPERDQSLYNFRQFGSYVAHGALIENLTIALKAVGFDAEVNVFPESREPNHVADLLISPTSAFKGSLYPAIMKRATNRKKYKKVSLTEFEKSNLLSQSDEVARLILLEDHTSRRRVAEVMTVGDRILFENKKVHDFLFSHINWTLEEERSRRTGFYIKTLELAPPQKAAFRIVKNWRVLNALNAIGFGKAAAKSNTKLYLASSAFGAVLIPNNSPENFIHAGRIMQRTWLTATNLELSIQPITAVIFFMQRILAQEAKDFDAYQVKLIESAYKTIIDEFNVENHTMAMLFRIGHGPNPSALPMRLEPDIRVI